MGLSAEEALLRTYDESDVSMSKDWGKAYSHS
jgi:hypothetical protein